MIIVIIVIIIIILIIHISISYSAYNRAIKWAVFIVILKMDSGQKSEEGLSFLGAYKMKNTIYWYYYSI